MGRGLSARETNPVASAGRVVSGPRSDETMRYVDYLFAWTILMTAVVFILVTESLHPRGAILDVPFLWIVIAIVNFIRLRNADVEVRDLKMFCVAANLIVLMLEVVRAKLLGAVILKNWGPYPLIVAIAVLGETVFSIARKNDFKPPAHNREK